jgi:nondiscriminating glutamyl-tRNA synthetase
MAEFIKKDISKDKAIDIDGQPRFRFAPSPTGGLHIGTARTALFNWLAAKSMGAKLILRIEDTDLKRSNKAFEDSIISDLKWLGLDWDEFYRQSDRLDIYIKYANKMLKEGKAYRCFCTPQRLEELKNEQYLQGKMSKYDNKCRDLGDEEVRSKIAGGVPFAVRFKVPQTEIVFKDLIRDEIRFNSDVFGDFVIMKSDNTPSYNFGVVVDDSDMSISHVLRGEDHITNTARQILLFESIGAGLPAFGHLSMILGKDGAKLSKRHGSQTITEFKAEGYLSDALCNYLALLSWAPRDGRDIFNFKDIVESFSISNISKSPAIFDIDKLSWINGNHIREKSAEDIFGLVMPFMKSGLIAGATRVKNEFAGTESLGNDNGGTLSNEETGYETRDVLLAGNGNKDSSTPSGNNNDDLARLKKGAEVFRDKMRVLADFPVLMKDYLTESVQNVDSDAAEVLNAPESRTVINGLLKELINFTEEKDFDDTAAFDETLCGQIIAELAGKLKTCNIKGKMLYMPIRAALTGQVHGPELPKVMSILGLKRCILRLKEAYQ